MGSRHGTCPGPDPPVGLPRTPSARRWSGLTWASSASTSGGAGDRPARLLVRERKPFRTGGRDPAGTAAGCGGAADDSPRATSTSPPSPTSRPPPTCQGPRSTSAGGRRPRPNRAAVPGIRPARSTRPALPASRQRAPPRTATCGDVRRRSGRGRALPSATSRSSAGLRSLQRPGRARRERVRSDHPRSRLLQRLPRLSLPTEDFDRIADIPLERCWIRTATLGVRHHEHPRDWGEIDRLMATADAALRAFTGCQARRGPDAPLARPSCPSVRPTVPMVALEEDTYTEALRGPTHIPGRQRPSSSPAHWQAPRPVRVATSPAPAVATSSGSAELYALRPRRPACRALWRSPATSRSGHRGRADPDVARSRRLGAPGSYPRRRAGGGNPLIVPARARGFSPGARAARAKDPRLRKRRRRPQSRTARPAGRGHPGRRVGAGVRRLGQGPARRG